MSIKSLKILISKYWNKSVLIGNGVFTQKRYLCYSLKLSHKKLINYWSLLQSSNSFTHMSQNPSPIFVADSSLVARRIFSIFLKPLSREVRYFANLQECALGFQQTAPWAVITSVNLPLGPDEGEPLSGGLILMAWLKKRLEILGEDALDSGPVQKLLKITPPENLPTFVFSSATDQSMVELIKGLEPCAYFEKSRFFNMESQTYVIQCIKKSLREKSLLV